MLLTPTWKRSVIAPVIKYITSKNNTNKATEYLKLLIAEINATNTGPNYTGIIYKSWHHRIPINEQSGDINQGYYINVHDPFFDKFTKYLVLHEENTKLASHVKNWLSTGLAMCHTTDCICELFPDILLDAINETVPLPNGFRFIRTGTNNPKFMAFIAKNKEIENSVKRQIVFNMIVPSN